MSKLNPDKIERAEQRFRKQLTYEEIKQLPPYKGLSEKEYDLLVNTIKSFSLILLESYIRSSNT